MSLTGLRSNKRHSAENLWQKKKNQSVCSQVKQVLPLSHTHTHTHTHTHSLIVGQRGHTPHTWRWPDRLRLSRSVVVSLSLSQSISVSSPPLSLCQSDRLSASIINTTQRGAVAALGAVAPSSPHLFTVTRCHGRHSIIVSLSWFDAAVSLRLRLLACVRTGLSMRAGECRDTPAATLKISARSLLENLLKLNSSWTISSESLYTYWVTFKQFTAAPESEQT